MTVEAATARTAGLLSNLLELYLHDLSEIFPIEIGPDGRFGYELLPRYWAEPETRFPFLIQRNGRVAGFALVTRGSPATTDPTDLDIAEFFVLRSYRRSGVGRQAAALLWDRMPGRWIVRVAESNQDGLPFWESAIRDYTNGDFVVGVHQGKTQPFRVYTFQSRAKPG